MGMGEMPIISVAMIMPLSMCRYCKRCGNLVGQVGMGNIFPSMIARTACAQAFYPSRLCWAVSAGREFVAYADHQFVLTSEDNLVTSVGDIRDKSAITGRNVGIYALFHMILADTDDAAEAQVRQIIDAADHGAISILASASLDTNTAAHQIN